MGTRKRRAPDTAAAPSGPRYRALTGLTYPTDPKIIKRILGGESIPFEDRGLKEVAAGDVVDDIPEVSLPWMLEQAIVALLVGRITADEHHMQYLVFVDGEDVTDECTDADDTEGYAIVHARDENGKVTTDLEDPTKIATKRLTGTVVILPRREAANG